MATEGSRPSAPAAVKRQLRQEAGFGCCVCGLPIYQYHHIVPWAVDPHFRPADMMILCPLHHDAASKGALTEEQQRAAKSSPRNIAEGLTFGELAINQSYLALAIGGVFLVGDGPLLTVDGETLLRTRLGEDNELLLSVRLFDRQDQLLAEIDDNEWITGDPLPWDLESDHQRLVIRSAPYGIALSIDAKQEPIRLRGELWRNGERIRLRPSGLELGDSIGFADIGLVQMGIDVVTGENRTIRAFGPSGAFASEADPVRRLIKCIETSTSCGRALP